MNKLCEFPSSRKFDLIYRATRDGFDAKDFHSKCDNKGNTLTIIKSTNGNIFGGYSEIQWTNSTNQLLKDPNAFLFSLVNKENDPFKVKCPSNDLNGFPLYPIHCSSTHGPAFGFNGGYGDYDLIISSQSNMNIESHSNFGYSFQHTSYPLGSQKAQSVLAGSYNFQTVEIEVFKAKKSKKQSKKQKRSK